MKITRVVYGSLSLIRVSRLRPLLVLTCKSPIRCTFAPHVQSNPTAQKSPFQALVHDRRSGLRAPTQNRPPSIIHILPLGTSENSACLSEGVVPGHTWTTQTIKQKRAFQYEFRVVTKFMLPILPFPNHTVTNRPIISGESQHLPDHCLVPPSCDCLHSSRSPAPGYFHVRQPLQDLLPLPLPLRQAAAATHPL